MLGTDEDLQSVRWFDDFAVVVTFRQVDPLHTIDLSDPTHPRALGVLKVPGYSGYLHPLGNCLLLGLGMTGSSTNGAQAPVFDIRTLTRPTRISSTDFGPDTGLPALDDPRNFVWLADSRTGVTSVEDWANGGGQLVALHVGPGGRLTRTRLESIVQGWQARALPLPGKRIAVVTGNELRIVPIG